MYLWIWCFMSAFSKLAYKKPDGPDDFSFHDQVKLLSFSLPNAECPMHFVLQFWMFMFQYTASSQIWNVNVNLMFYGYCFFHQQCASYWYCRCFDINDSTKNVTYHKLLCSGAIFTKGLRLKCNLWLHIYTCWDIISRLKDIYWVNFLTCTSQTRLTGMFLFLFNWGHHTKYLVSALRWL